ncbi:MAG TPA: IS1380 family transposase [Microlunatus sp.]|nr:IS1380 family transposase [Microlunatus sp.]
MGDSGLVEGSGSVHEEGTCQVQRIAAYPRVEVSADGTGVVSHVGSRLLADVAAVVGLPEAFDEAAGGHRKRCSAHAPGRVLTDLAVLLADGGQTITDLAVLRHQPGLFGPVASTATAWRVLDSVDDTVLAGLKRARARARERAWLLRAEAGRPIPTLTCAGTAVPGLVIDLDASLVTCHSEKEQAASTFKKGFGYHPLLAWLDNTDEALAGMLRPGNAGSNTAADHIQVTDEALAQIPDVDRHGQPILVRSDGAGATKEWLNHLRGLRDEQGLQVSFSVGFTVSHQVKDAVAMLPETVWGTAVDATGQPRPVDQTGLPVASVAELTGLLPGLTAAGWPEGMRVLVRRERPHPGAQISLFEAHDGWRYQCVATDTDHGQLAFLEARHRAHAHVEDRVKAIKQTGMGRFPSREFTINQVWLQLALTSTDLIAWTQTILLHGLLAQVEIKQLRYRLLHTAARIVHGQRKVRIRIDTTWPWAAELAAAFTRLATIRQPLII